MITREFKKILRRRENFRRRKPLNKGDPSTKKKKEKDHQITCYGYKKPRHYRHECPQLKKRTKIHKKKTMIVTWGESDESSFQLEEENDKVANLCLMALEDKVCLASKKLNRK